MEARRWQWAQRWFHVAHARVHDLGASEAHARVARLKRNRNEPFGTDASPSRVASCCLLLLSVNCGSLQRKQRYSFTLQ